MISWTDDQVQRSTTRPAVKQGRRAFFFVEFAANFEIKS